MFGFGNKREEASKEIVEREPTLKELEAERIGLTDSINNSFLSEREGV